MHKTGEQDDTLYITRHDGLNYDNFFEGSISNDFDNMNVIGNGKITVPVSDNVTKVDTCCSS